MIIPYQDINLDTLDNLIREFVLREGTDYGEQEIALDTKVKQVLDQLKSGKLVITYSEEYQSIDITVADRFSMG